MLIRLKKRSFFSLKTSVMVAFGLFWNAGFLLAIYLGGKGIEGLFGSVGSKIIGSVFLAAAVFALLVASSTSAQRVLLEPRRAHDFRPFEFYFVAVVSCFVGIMSFLQR
jgi:hypothetical protein